MTELASAREIDSTATGVDRSKQHLLARLGILEERVRAAVAERRATDRRPDDPFRGLYLSDELVDDLLSRPGSAVMGSAAASACLEGDAIEFEADAWELSGQPIRLRSLAHSFDLDRTDVELLLVAVAPDLDPRFDRLYGYLHDDVARRRATIGLALELCGLSWTDADARSRLSAHGPLVRHGIVAIEEADRPILGRSLRVRDRVSQYLLGDDRPDAELAPVLADPPPDDPDALLNQGLAAGIPLIYLQDEGTGSSMSMAAGSIAAFGANCLAIDVGRLTASARPIELAAAAIREARLTHSVLLAGSIELVAAPPVEVIRTLAQAEWPTILVGARPWDPTWSTTVPLLLDAPRPSPAARVEQWTRALARAEPDGDVNRTGLVEATRGFRMSVAQIARATEAGSHRARAAGRRLEPADVRAGARAQNAAGLERLARRISPVAGWGDLVLPGTVTLQLRELIARVRHRDQVREEWQVGGRSSRGRGTTGLFGGESGTGKTLAAEVVAGELGLDLYVIDLSTVIDKYIGETEKNLDRIFSEADRINGVLLFDEADAIFGKRSEVRDARDRYANVEVAYLLQRMERFDGLAILTTNLRANLDDAFTRRLDVIIDFPMPDEAARLTLWRMHLPERLPQAPDIDLEFMARCFRLSGGHVRNICLAAAYLAAERDAAVSMEDIVRGTDREYRKLGRLTLEDEFGPYHSLVVADRQ